MNKVGVVPLGSLIRKAASVKAGQNCYQVLSMTMRDGLIEQASKFKKRVASQDLSGYKIVRFGQLVVGFPIDEGVLAVQDKLPLACVSPAYNIWNIDQEIVDTRYLHLFLRSDRALSYYNAKLRGTTARRRTLPDEVFLRLEIPLPPLEEQRRIAAILDKAENLRLLAQLSSSTLASFKESVFLDMFGSPTQSFSPWPVLPLGETARLENGDRSANYPSGDDIKEDGVLFLSTKNILNNKLDLGKTAFITTNKFNSLTQGKARPGDLVITLRGTLGSCCIFSCSHETAFINAQMMLIRPHEPLLPVYLHALLTTSAFQSRLQSLGYGAAVRQLSSSQLSSLPIPVPPISTQLEFSSRLNRALEAIASCDVRYEKINQLLHSIQIPVFSGLGTV
jgi:type I restriction enzyme S subunit